ncbi:MAG: hypothetical protein AAFY88_20960, partial [Acidobacteriota bacterium]
PGAGVDSGVGVARIGTPPSRSMISCAEPSWSPSGEHIAFATAGGGISQLSLVDGSVTELLDAGSRPVYSPDGTALAFQGAHAPLLSDTSVPAMPPSTLGLYDLETGESRRLTWPDDPAGGHGQPSWAPDGRHLVFASTGRSVGELWAVHLEDGYTFPLLREPADAYDPVVGPDGASIYFSLRSLEVKTLWRLDVDPESFEPRGEPVEIAGLGLSSIRQPRLSPDGRHLVFAAYVTSSNLWRLPLAADGTAGGEPRALTRGEDRHNRPAFSPDGSQVLYDHWKLGVDIDLFIQDVDGATRRRQLTDFDGSNSHGSWRADGRIFYRAESPAGARTLRSLSADGVDREVLALEDDVDWVVLSPADESFAFHSRRGGQGLDVWIQGLDGSPAWRLTFHDQSAGFPAFSPDGRRVTYQVRTGRGTHLWLIPLDGGEPQMLLAEDGESWPYGFSADGSKILYAGQRGGVWNLYWIEVEGRRIERLTDNRAVTGYLRYPTMSPAGDMVLYERAESKSDLFIVRDFLGGD